jgi:dihydroneopterin aldolase
MSEPTASDSTVSEPTVDFSSCDCIQIDGIQVSGRHGVSASEREACLPLDISLSLKVNLALAEKSDDLDDTVNYSKVRAQVVTVVEKQSFKLLERLAGAIFEELFTDSRIEVARVRISKPQRLGGATPAVTLVRRNPFRQ